MRMPRAIPSGPTKTSAITVPPAADEARLGDIPANGNCTRIISITPPQLSSSQYMRLRKSRGRDICGTTTGSVERRPRARSERLIFAGPERFPVGLGAMDWETATHSGRCGPEIGLEPLDLKKKTIAATRTIAAAAPLMHMMAMRRRALVRLGTGARFITFRR